MPRSSRTKSRKHSSREVRDYSDSEEDLKRNGKEEVSVRVSKDSMSGDKRKVTGKDLLGHGNGVDVADEVVVVSKRRKDKAEGGGGSDRWNADAQNDAFVDVKMETFNSKAKEKEKVLVDSSRSKTGRRHDSDKKDELLTVVAEEESKSGRVESKRKGDKEYGRKEYKEKERWDKEKLLEDGKDVEFTRKHGLHSVDVVEERHGKRSRENIEGPVQDLLRNPELEKELDKRIRRRVDGSSEKDKYQDDARDYDEKRSSKGDRSKDVWSKDERHGDKYNEDNEKYSRHKEDKYREDSKDSRYKDAKYREEGEKENRYRDAKYREDSDRDNTNCDDNYREDGDRDKRHKDEKYREDGERNIRHREDKYHEDGVKDDRHRDDRYREDVNKDSRHKEEKHRENADRDRDGKRRDVKHRNDSDRDKRSRDVKYRDDHSSRDRISDSEKRLRDENNASDHHYRKSSNRDGSPAYDDRGSRYKDDRGNRKATDKEDHNDIRSQSTKEQQFDAEKRSGSNKVDLITDRGRSNFRNADADVTLNHSRRRSSPSSSTHGARDHYRVSKLEESKYRDYGYEDRTRQNGSSGREFNGAKQNEKVLSSRLMEKSIQKDDSQFNESSLADRRLRSDARASPLRMVDKSPSSTSNDRRHLNRTDVRRSIEKEESGQRSGGSRDYTGRDGKGGRELPMHTHPVDEYSQADGDKSSASSPFTRNFSSNSRSILPPPPPFRTGVDSPSGFGPAEDDNRGRFNNRHRRGGDSNMGRSQGNAWKGIPNWPSPVTNGYIPFPHGPPPVGFHAVMQQFPSPPMFGVRPTMDMNHSLPYHMSDADRFPGHGRQLGWRNSVDDSAPPVHGWDANNSVFGDDNRGYGRVDWDQNRTQMGSRGWDTSGDMWKGPNSGLNTELTSAPQKEDLKHSAVDDVLAGQQTQIEQNQPNGKADSLDVQSIDALPNLTLNPSENPPLKSHENLKMSTKDDVYDHNVYLSKLDISTDLTEPELYDQLTSLMDFNSNTLAFEDDVKIFYVEDALEAKVPDQIMSSAINNSVFQKAMSLYEKQKGETEAAKRERAQTPSSEYLKIQGLYNEKAALTDGDSGALVSFCGEQGREDAVSDHKEHDLPRDAEESQPACKKLDETFLIDNMVGPEGKVRMGNVTEMEVDPGSRQENVSTPLLNVERSSPLLPSNLEEMPPSSPVVSHSADDEHRLTETKCATMLLSDVSAEAMMPESVESGSVYLSRIHHSPESTH